MAYFRLILLATACGCTAPQGPGDTVRSVPTDPGTEDPVDPGTSTLPTSTNTSPGSTPEVREPIAITDLGYRPIDTGDPLLIEDCGGERAPGARGDCFRFTFEPVSWDWPQYFSAALFFVEGADWGLGPTGIDIDPGATSIQFQVKSNADDVYVYYLAGLDDADSGTFQDDWTVLVPDPPLPAPPQDRALLHPAQGDWQTVRIDLSGQTYTEINMPFALVIPNDMESQPGALDYEELNSPFETHVVSIDDIVITW